MFGPALMVAPVLAQGAVGRRVYLPEAQVWYNFWTGDSVQGGHETEAGAPLNRLPLCVRSGSILPMGPEIQYATDDPDGPIELRIYRGAPGSFDLYEDSGDSYDYEKGTHSIIPLRWNEKRGVSTIGTRRGSFPGMVGARQFRVMLVGNGHGVGEAVSAREDRQVMYDGREVYVPLRG